jgi:hypothetical protein
MLTKYILTIDGVDYELHEDDLQNWDEIECSYKRSDYDGVVRSFTSKFCFTNAAYERLMALYLKDGYTASASIAVYTLNDRWTYDKQFECPLDFSTITWESHKLSLNAVDSSLAAVIKANKSTKYEFKVGEDMSTDGKMNFKRLPMVENVTYELTQGENYSDCADLLVTFTKGEHPYMGTVEEEIFVKGTIAYNDDQESDTDSYILQAVKDVEVTLDWAVGIRQDYFSYGVNLLVRIKRNGALLPITDGTDGNGGYLCGAAATGVTLLGKYNSSVDLPEASNHIGTYALIDGLVWYVDYNGSYYYWNTEGKTVAEQYSTQHSGSIVLNLQTNDYVLIEHEFINASINQTAVRFTDTSFNFSWQALGDPEDIDVIRPKTAIETLLNRLVEDDNLYVAVDISEHDSRLADTYLLAAESARGLSTAKFYSSFNEFCDWMSTVFGYIYYIGDRGPSEYDQYMECGTFINTPYDLESTYSGEVDTNNIVFISTKYSRFVYVDNGTYYEKWQGWENYNHPGTMHPRTDRLYRFNRKNYKALYRFDEYTEGATLVPIETEYDTENYLKDKQVVHFVHRSEVMNPEAEVRTFAHCTDLSYSVEASKIYSTVTIGYDSQDYDSINGRDEFNFNNTYTTGCTVSDKTLSLLSKYRADCYGIEFAVQERGADTTDSDSDNDVFFVLCKQDEETGLVPDQSITIEGALSDHVFNAAFSPMACIQANAGYIGMQANNLLLKFASSEGNSDVVIGGVGMSDDISIDAPLATPGVVEFTTDEVDLPDATVLMEVEDDGVIYRGFLQEVDLKFAKEEAAKYKLIVKDIEL